MRQTLARPADAERNPRTCAAERNRCASGTLGPILSFAVALHQSSGWLTDGACRTSVARSPCPSPAARRSSLTNPETEGQGFYECMAARRLVRNRPVETALQTRAG